MAVRPQILVLGSRGHRRAGFSSAELGQDAVEDVDLVIEFDGVDSEPLVEILARR